MNYINNIRSLFKNPFETFHDCIQKRDVILRDLNPNKPGHEKAHYYLEVLSLSKEKKIEEASHLLKKALIISILVLPIYDLYHSLLHAGKAIGKIIPAVTLPILEAPLYLIGFGIEYEDYNLSAVFSHAIKTIQYVTMAASSPFLAIHPKTDLFLHEFLGLTENQINNYEYEKAAQSLIEKSSKILSESREALKIIRTSNQPESIKQQKTKIEQNELELRDLISNFEKAHPEISTNPQNITKTHEILRSKITSLHNRVIRVWQNAASILPDRLKEIEDNLQAEMHLQKAEKEMLHKLTFNTPFNRGSHISAAQFLSFYVTLFKQTVKMGI